MSTWSKRLLSLVLGLAVAFVSADVQLAGKQLPVAIDKDPLLGTWSLNLAKSKYSPGPPPKSQTRTYQQELSGAETRPLVSAGVKTTVKTVDSAGHTTSVEYISKYDGVEYPVAGSPNSDMITLKKIDAYRAEAIVTHAGKEIASAKRVISADGKTMTITYEGMWEGQSVHNLVVFDKQSTSQ